jgi:hypothetical protein
MDNFDLKKYLTEGKLLKEVQNKLPLEIIQDMYLVAATIDQGYEPAHDMKGAEEKGEKYEQQYPNEYDFVSSIFAEDEYAGPDVEPTTDKETLEAVGYTLDQIRGI